MYKQIFLLVFCLWLAACYAQPKKSALPAPSQPEKATALAAHPTTPAPSAAPAEQTAAPDTEMQSAPQAASVEADIPSTTPTTDDTASAGRAPTAPTGQAAQTSAPQPAPDKAVFEDEKLIEFEGRQLHPYAALVPDDRAPQQAPWAYEQLKYGLYYTFIKAGTAYIRNRGLVDINGRAAYLLQTTAFSAPVIDAFFKVRDVNQSWLDAENFYSLGYGQSVREGGYRRDEWVTFDYPNQKYSGQIQKKADPSPIEGPLNIKVLDMLTSLYYVRSQKLVPGQDLIFDIINREKQYPLVVKVLGKDKVKTDAGTFDCIIVEPQIRGEGIFVSKGKSLKVWLTDDEYKMPVKMQVEVFIGSVSAKLLAYQRQEPANIL